MTDERLKAYLEGAETAYSVADAEQEQMQTELAKLRAELASQAAKIEAVRGLCKHYSFSIGAQFLIEKLLAALES